MANSPLLMITLSALMATTIPLHTEEASAGQILYLMKGGNINRSLDLYMEYAKDKGQHDLDLLRELGLYILDNGASSNKTEIQMLTLFGAGISVHEKTLYILESGIQRQEPELQIIALNMLARYQNDDADHALLTAMRSNFVMIRLEAAFHLCQKKHPQAIAHVEALMQKVPPEIHPIFPPLFSLVGNEQAIRNLKRLMNNSDSNVRVAAVMSAASHQRDDLLPMIRTLATQHDIAQQEATAFALGQLRDESSIKKLQQLTQSKTKHVRLAAHFSLYLLGEKSSLNYLVAQAKERDPYAITLLGKIPGQEDVLAELLSIPDLTIRTNVALALLERKDSRCLKAIAEVLVRDPRDLAYVKQSSLGKSLHAWRVIPSAEENIKENPYLRELSLGMREETLVKALELPEKDFLALAQLMFELHQNELVPSLVRLLENVASPSAINLLKFYSQKTGAPLIRNYCNLALYRQKEEGPYYENLKKWINDQHNIDLIRFRPFIPMQMRDEKSKYQLTPEETSRLLVESFESLIEAQDERGIDILLHAIRYGNSNNKYALAGLLIHATL